MYDSECCSIQILTRRVAETFVKKDMELPGSIRLIASEAFAGLINIIQKNRPYFSIFQK